MRLDATGFRVSDFLFEFAFRSSRLLEGSWDLVTRVIIKVTILIITYNPN